MSIFQLLIESIKLDMLFVKNGYGGVFFKLNFILKKYYLILKHFIIPFKLSVSKINIVGNPIYYDGVYGIAGLQRILSSHYNMISSINNIKTVIDIGANVGYFSYMINITYPKSKVLSLEPAPITFNTLEKNLAPFKNNKCLNYAISSKKGTLGFSFDVNQSFLGKIDEESDLKVKAETLDSIFLKNFKNIDLLKIDVEGFESDVLTGGMVALKNTKYLMIEVTLKDNANYSFSSIIGMLHSKDFNYQLISFRSFNNELDAADLLFKNLNYENSLS